MHTTSLTMSRTAIAPAIAVLVIAFALVTAPRAYAQENSEQNGNQGAQLVTAIGQCRTPGAMIRRGQSGENVRRLQEFLVSRGHLSSENSTGFFGRITEQAVQRFQAERGLVTAGTPSTTGFGRVGSRTLAIMRSLCGNAASSTNPVVTHRNENGERNENNNSNRTPADVFDEWMRNTNEQESDTHVVCHNASVCDLLSVSPAVGERPLTVTFYNWSSASSSYVIDFGDGTQHGSIAQCTMANGACVSGGAVTHTYANLGQYQARLFRNEQIIGAQRVLVVPSNSTATSTSTSTPAVTVSILTQTFYRNLYACVLNREGSNAEVQSWVGLHQRSVEGLRNGFRGFFNSVEYGNKHVTNEIFVDTLYRCVLNREGESAGRTYWINQLANGTSRAAVVDGFLNASEFTNLVVPRWRVLTSPTAMIATDAQVASVLSAVQNAINAIMSYFKPKAAPADTAAETSSAPQQWGPTGEKKTPAAPAPAPTGTLHAEFKGVAFPDVMNVTKDLAQLLCRPDAVCTWNNEPIQAVASFGQPGDPTITFTLPAPASKQTLKAGTGYTFELSDSSMLSGAVNADSYRLYFAKYTSKNGPDVIYQAKITSVQRTLSGAVQLKWDGKIVNGDGSVTNLPLGFYYVGAVNGTNALKGGSTGSVTVTQ